MGAQRTLSPYIYLMSLAVCDFLTGISMVVYRVFNNAAILYMFPEISRITSTMFIPLHYVTNSLATGATFLVNALSWDRLIAIRYPMHRSIWCTTRRARITSVLLVISGCLLNLDSFVRLRIAWWVDPETGSAIPSIGYTDIGRNPIVGDVSLYMKFAIKQIIPLSMMIVTNTLTLKELANNQKFRSKSAQGHAKTDVACLGITVGVIVVFILTNIPKAYYTFHATINDYPDKISITTGIILSSSELLGWTNTCNNFVIYTILNAKFRDDLRHLLKCKKRRSLHLLQ